jgi:hypothetical protein
MLINGIILSNLICFSIIHTFVLEVSKYVSLSVYQKRTFFEVAKWYNTPSLLDFLFVLGYSGDADPPCPVMLTPHKDYGSENLND